MLLTLAVEETLPKRDEVLSPPLPLSPPMPGESAALAEVVVVPPPPPPWLWLSGRLVRFVRPRKVPTTEVLLLELLELLLEGVLCQTRL